MDVAAPAFKRRMRMVSNEFDEIYTNVYINMGIRHTERSASNRNTEQSQTEVLLSFT